jgi:hypothetical protein
MTFCQQFTIAESHYQVSTDSPIIAEHLQHIFAGFHTSTTLAPITFTVQQNPDHSIHVSPKLEETKTYTTIDEFVSHFEWQLVRSAFDRMHFLGVHSGGVVYNGKTILFPGQSGKGKSTLTLGCALQGWALLSDEMVFIRPNTPNAHAFPRVLCIKNDGHIFQELDTHHILQQPHIARHINNSICISPQALKTIPQDQPCTIDMIVFPNYHPSDAPKLIPLSPVKSLTRLLQLTYKRTQSPQILDTLGHIVETVPSYELTMNNLSDAITQVQNLAN